MRGRGNVAAVLRGMIFWRIRRSIGAWGHADVHVTLLVAIDGRFAEETHLLPYLLLPCLCFLRAEVFNFDSFLCFKFCVFYELKSKERDTR